MTVFVQEPGKFDCNTCTWGRYCDASNPAPFEQWEVPAINMKSAVCLKPMVTEHSHALLRLWRHYRAGILPYSGGIMNQPTAYIEAMELIDAHA